MSQARQSYELHIRTEALRRQAAQWKEAKELKDYVEAMALHIDGMPEAETPQALEWLAFAEQHLMRLNPLKHLLQVPVVGDPSPNDLQPFLKGWSPYGPH